VHDVQDWLVTDVHNDSVIFGPSEISEVINNVMGVPSGLADVPHAVPASRLLSALGAFPGSGEKGTTWNICREVPEGAGGNVAIQELSMEGDHTDSDDSSGGDANDLMEVAGRQVARVHSEREAFISALNNMVSPAHPAPV
jgi:hypothetical protein